MVVSGGRRRVGWQVRGNTNVVQGVVIEIHSVAVLGQNKYIGQRWEVVITIVVANV